MISLYESILSSTKAGKTVMVEKWCEEFEPFNKHWKINSKGEIECTQKGEQLWLKFDTYNRLPDYIRFADDDDLKVTIGCKSSMYKENIVSLQGIPYRCKQLSIYVNCQSLPAFEASPVNFYFNGANIKSTGKIVINIRPQEDGSGEVRIKDVGYQPKTFAEALPNMHIKGAKIYDCVNCGYIGDTMSKILNRKAEMNKYKGHFETPIKDEALPGIVEYFGKNFDLSKLEEISYTQNSRLLKRNGKWYRCKNWL